MRGYTREAEIYDRVQELARGEHSAIVFGTNLADLAVSYVATFNPEHETWNDHPLSTREAIAAFNLLNIRPIRALLLAVAYRFRAP